jgi:hypothetical protein
MRRRGALMSATRLKHDLEQNEDALRNFNEARAIIGEKPLMRKHKPETPPTTTEEAIKTKPKKKGKTPSSSKAQNKKK